jgi:hypothetical protein
MDPKIVRRRNSGTETTIGCRVQTAIEEDKSTIPLRESLEIL